MIFFYISRLNIFHPLQYGWLYYWFLRYIHKSIVAHHDFSHSLSFHHPELINLNRHIANLIPIERYLLEPDY